MPNKCTHEEFMEKFKQYPSYEHIIILDKYINSSTKLRYMCKYCHKEHYASPNQLSKTKSGCRCKDIPRNTLKKSHSEYLEDLRNRNISDIVPIEEYLGKSTKSLHKCLVCNYEWKVTPQNILNGHGCPVHTNRAVVCGINDMWTTNPELARLLANPDDGYKYTQCSGIKVDWKCPDCNNLILQRKISSVFNQGLSCAICRDYISIPTKIVFSLLSENNIQFVSDTTFDWSNSKRYDFYIPKTNTIIEVHGSQHYSKGFEYLGGRTPEEEQENDTYKKQLAMDNGIANFYSLDFARTDVKYVYNSLAVSKFSEVIGKEIDIQYLKHIFQISHKSRIFQILDIWDSGVKDIYEISNKTKLSKWAVLSRLKMAEDIGLCNTNERDYPTKKKQCVLLKTGEIFESIYDAHRKTGVDRLTIRHSCNGSSNNKDWMFYNDYISNAS